MEGTILGIDNSTQTVAIKTATGSRCYFPISEWKGATPPEVGMTVDYDSASEGQASIVYPTGRKVPLINDVKPSKTKTTTTLLALFLGGIGAHKFYLGLWGWGVLYLIFCWTYIPLLISIIETIMLIMQTDEEFQRKYESIDGPFGFMDG